MVSSNKEQQTRNETIMRTFTITKGIDDELGELIEELNKSRITGALSKSKILRIALTEYIEKQKKVMQILKEHSEINKTAEQLLKENGLL